MVRGKEDTLAVGIDFGTTNSTVCFALPGGTPQVVPIRQPPEKDTLPYLPGYIYFAGGKRVLVGRSAKKFFHLKPHRVVKSVKRGLDAIVRIGVSAYAGTDLAQIVFRHLLRECRQAAGRDAVECVLTVPSTFGHRERMALRDALLDAVKSIKRVHLLDEPLAAFIAHTRDAAWRSGRHPGSRDSENVLLIDMGGGTTDLAVLSLAGKGESLKVSPLAVWSHVKLGGDDFDRAIALDIAARRAGEGLLPYDGLTESERKYLWSNFLLAAEDIKLGMENHASAVEAQLAGLQGEKPWRVAVTWERVVQACRPLLDELRESVRYVLQRGRLAKDDLGRVILTGGMSRSGIIRAEVRHFLGRDAVLGADPQSAVARGACLYHASLLDPGRRDIETLRPVMTRALFLRMSSCSLHRLLPSCLPLPARTRLEGKFVSPLTRTRLLRIPFYQGNDDGSDARPLLTLTIQDEKVLPPGLPVTLEVEVDENKMISVTVRAGDGGGGREKAALEKSAQVWGL
jgi:molecular chaperone DnaK (HSP70)